MKEKPVIIVVLELGLTAKSRSGYLYKLVFKDRITHLYPEIIFVESNVVTDNGERLLQTIIENSNKKDDYIQAHSLPRSCCKIS